MRFVQRLLVCAFSCGVACAGARAEEGPGAPIAPPSNNPGGLGVGILGGTTGIGGELSIRPAQTLVLRGGGSWFGLNRDFSTDGNSYKLKADLVSAGLTLDWHPFTNGFRFSLGGRYHNANLSGSLDGVSFAFNGHTYTSATTGAITASVKSASAIAPFIGIGYDSTHFSDSRWAIAFDIGAVYTGKPTTTISAQNEAAVAGLRTDLNVEQQKLDDAVGKYGQFWPVATIALKFRF